MEEPRFLSDSEATSCGQCVGCGGCLACNACLACAEADVGIGAINAELIALAVGFTSA